MFEKRIGSIAMAVGLALAFSTCKRNTDSIPSPPPPASLSVSAADACEISGVVYRSIMPNAPALILLHAQGGNHSDWALLSEKAQREGYFVIAADMRGHGGSICDSKLYRAFGPSDWISAEADVAVLKQAALDAGANSNNIFLVGAGLGANLALRYALTDPQIQAAVLLSPGEEYLGVSIEGLGVESRALPILIVAAEGDSYSSQSAERLHRDSPGYAELRLYAGTAFGSDLLEGAPESTALILRWLDDIVQ